MSEAVAYELPLSYFTDGVPYAMKFLQKNPFEEQIIRRIEDSGISAASKKRLKESRERLGAFRRIEDCVERCFRKEIKMVISAGIEEAIRQIAPPHLAEEWDNCGFQIRCSADQQIERSS